MPSLPIATDPGPAASPAPGVDLTRPPPPLPAMAPAPQAVGDGAPMPQALPPVGPALAEAARPTGRLPGMLIALVAVGFFMQALDSTIVNTALPALARAFGESPLRMQSVVISYVLTVAVLVPASGYLADRFGTRGVFVAALGLFTLGSWGCASAPTLNLLVAARVLQGVGGAMLLPVGRLAVLKAVPRRDFLKAMSVIAIPGMLGPLLGPTLGGWLTETVSWRWIFLINLPVGVVAVVLALKRMPDFREPPETRAHFDGWGFGLISGAMLLLTLGLEAFGRSGSSRPVASLMAIGGLVLMTSYVIHATRIPRPLFPLDLFKVHSFSVGVSGNLFARLGMGGMPMLLPLMMQVGFGLTAIESGLSLLPMAIAGLFARQPVNRLIGRFGYRRVLVLNTVVLGALMAAFATLGTHTPHVLRLGLLVLFGSANAIQYTAMNALTLKDLEGSQTSSGNGLLSMVMQLSMALGVAVAAALLHAFASGGGAELGSASLPAFHATFLCLGGLTMASAWVFWHLDRTTARRQSEEDGHAPVAADAHH